MKFIFFILFLLNFSLNISAQNFNLILTGSSDLENKTIDSINYISKHKEAKSINDETIKISNTLLKIGYIDSQILENYKVNDSTFAVKFSLGNCIKNIHIYIGRNNTLRNSISMDVKKDTLVLPYIGIESFLNQTLQKLEQQGFALAKLKLTTIHKKKNTLYSELHFESGPQRQLNTIVVKFGESIKKNNFPEGHIKQINKKYKNRIFNQNVVEQVYNDFAKIGFVNQIKYPEILFTNDTTKVYVYLERKKSNNFDGYIGFSNNESKKIVFNGYLDLNLENALKSGEQISLYWKSDGNNQKTFKAGANLPYIFKSPFGLKAQIHIFKQDSVFQNTKTNLDLGYFLNYNTRIYLGYQSAESSDIQNTNNNIISDYKNTFLTSNFEYSKFDSVNSTFPKKTTVSITFGTGKRTTNNIEKTAGTNKQSFIHLNTMHNFYLNKKNCVNINYQNYFLKSDTYIINELYRFGGINSIRGFAENSLQANFMTAFMTEYRYIISSDLYVHSITDYGHYQDDSSDSKGNLLGIGFGMGLKTKNGLLKFALTNGSTKNQKIKFYNSIINLSYTVVF